TDVRARDPHDGAQDPHAARLFRFLHRDGNRFPRRLDVVDHATREARRRRDTDAKDADALLVRHVTHDDGDFRRTNVDGRDRAPSFHLSLPVTATPAGYRTGGRWWCR